MASPLSLTELVFTLIVFVAVLGLFTRYAVLVLSGTLLAVVWVMVDLFGASLFLAILLLGMATILRMVVSLGTERFDTPGVARFLDELLRRRQASEQDHQERRLQHRDTEQIDTDVASIDDYRR